MDLEYKFENKHIDLMKEQVWEAKDNIEVYKQQSLRDYSQISKHLPLKPKTVMDLGCGLGRATIMLNAHYKNKKIEYILADRTGRTVNTGEFNPAEDQFYNDLNMTADFVRLNEVDNFKVLDTEEGDWEALPNLDLVLSDCSVGFHLPIERYLDKLLAKATPKSVFIFGVGHWTPYGPESFSELFKETIYQKEEYIPGFANQSWLILKNPNL